MSKTNLNQQPIIVLGLEEVAGCITTGYEFNTDGSLKVISIDEAMADSRLVWVVSLNERVNDSGVFVPVPSTNLTSDDAHTGVNQANFRAGENYALNINEVEILDRKECWICGGAEVSIVGMSEMLCSSFRRFDIKDFIRVQRWELGRRLSVNQQIFSAGSGVKVDNTIAWIWYEFDKAKAKDKTMIMPCGSTLTYKSNDDPYGIQDPFVNVLSDPGNFNWATTGDYSYPNTQVNTGSNNVITFKFKKVAP